jgi:hypothetical protein
VYPGYAIVSRPDPTNSHVQQSFTLRNGSWSAFGTGMPVMPNDKLVDLSAFNVAAVATTFAGALQSLGIPDGNQLFMSVGPDIISGEMTIAIHTSAIGYGFMNVNPDGTIRKIFPP